MGRPVFDIVYHYQRDKVYNFDMGYSAILGCDRVIFLLFVSEIRMCVLVLKNKQTKPAGNAKFLLLFSTAMKLKNFTDFSQVFNCVVRPPPFIRPENSIII